MIKFNEEQNMLHFVNININEFFILYIFVGAHFNYPAVVILRQQIIVL